MRAVLMAASVAALDLRGVVLVTGGSRGIGAACCRALARDGFAVGVNYRAGREAAETLVRELVDHGHTARAFEADVGVESAVVSMFGELDGWCAAIEQPLIGLVNNAGVLGPAGALNDLDSAALRSVLETNVAGPLV